MASASRYFTVLFFALCLVSCGGRAAVGPKAGVEPFDVAVYTPRYACGFEIAGSEGRQSTILRVRNPWQGADGIATELLIVRGGESVPDGFTGQVLNGEAQRVVCMSSTHIAMLDAVGVAERIVGVSGLAYVTNPGVAARRSRTADVGYEGNIDYERMSSVRPDMVLLYGVNGASGMESKLRELRIPYVYIGDYLEESPLGKAEWMVAAGEIAGCRERAESLFAAIPERYDALKALVSESSSPPPAVMLNTPYGDTWVMAPRRSYMARLIADAGGRYLYDRNDTTRSLPIDIEEAAMLAARADVWLNVGQLSSLAELRRSLPRFADVKCVREGRVWNCNRRTNSAGGNDYWESGVVHPDIILRDLVAIFHPGLLPDHEPFYYRRLE